MDLRSLDGAEHYAVVKTDKDGNYVFDLCHCIKKKMDSDIYMDIESMFKVYRMVWAQLSINKIKV